MQPVPSREEDPGFLLNLLRSTIQHYFIVNDVRYDQEAFAFFVQLDPRTLEQDFDDLRREMLDLGFVPMLIKERPGYVVYVTRKPERQFRSIYVNVAFLAVTIVTTIIAGMSFVASYEDLSFWSLESAALGALFFALPLMFILGVHEMGHYFMARRHRVAASLPFFIPAPPILGTFGAFISLREPIHSKRALMDIGFAGPIVGFVAALGVTILGLKLSAWDPHPVGDDASAYWILGTPLIYDLLTYIVPTPDDILIHPTAFAGWVGFLVTFLNLLPAGQLDGGHIVRALFGDKSKYVGYATVVLMLIFSWWFNYPGWIVFIVFILFVIQHPPPLNDISPLPPDRMVVGMAAFLLLMVCFVPAPFMPSELNPDLEVHFQEPSLNVELGASVNATLVLVNTGNTGLDVRVRLQRSHGWNITFEDKLKGAEGALAGQLSVPKDRSTNFTTTLNMTVAHTVVIPLGTRTDFVVEVLYNDRDGNTVKLTPRVRVTAGWVDRVQTEAGPYVEVGGVSSWNVSFRNRVFDPADGETVFGLHLELPDGLVHTVTVSDVSELTAEEVGSRAPLANVSLDNNSTARVRLWVHAPNGTAEAKDMMAYLNLTVDGHEGVVVPIVLTFDVVYAVYDVSIDADTPVDFARDEIKTVAFTLTSDSNVRVVVALTYYLDEANWTVVNSHDSVTLQPSEEATFTLRLAAEGDVGTTSDLEIQIAYGPAAKRKSVTIQLRIVDLG